MNSKYLIWISGALLLATATACGGSKNQKADATQQEIVTVNVPSFNADSAYQFVKAQVDFGPRVPNSKEHVACGNYLAQQLENYGAKVTSQNAELIAYNGTLLKARNIIGSFQPENKKRIALFAHWDSRPWADNDPDAKNHYTPILGANDGASGVGVLLEIARQIQQQQPNLGVDIIFLDAEDYGTHQKHNGNSNVEAWCLGAQYWARNPHTPNYNARFGILLDMVGGHNPTFYREYYSEQFAKDTNRKVWDAAKRLGYNNYFIDENGGGATDDHLFINRIAGIKTIDIIPHNPGEGWEFDPHWHTVKDDMNNINAATLGAVGQTVMEVIYNEK